MTINTNHLLGYQFAEFDRAGLWRGLAMAGQFLIAVLSAISIFVADQTHVYYIAVFAFIVLIATIVFEFLYGKHRDAGESARRAVLIVDGKGGDLSENEKRKLNDQMHVSAAKAEAKKPGDDYYASNAAKGWRRVAEMIQQSAYFTYNLQRASGGAMFAILVLVLAPILVGVFLALPTSEAEANMLGARLLLVLLIFLLSSGVVVSTLGHFRSASSVEKIEARAAAILAAPDCSEADTLLLMADYNAVVQASPLIAPGIYSAMRNALNKKWLGPAKAKPAANG